MYYRHMKVCFSACPVFDSQKCVKRTYSQVCSENTGHECEKRNPYHFTFRIDTQRSVFGLSCCRPICATNSKVPIKLLYNCWYITRIDGAQNDLCHIFTLTGNWKVKRSSIWSFLSRDQNDHEMERKKENEKRREGVEGTCMSVPIC